MLCWRVGLSWNPLGTVKRPVRDVTTRTLAPHVTSATTIQLEDWSNTPRKTLQSESCGTNIDLPESDNTGELYSFMTKIGILDPPDRKKSRRSDLLCWNGYTIDSEAY